MATLHIYQGLPGSGKSTMATYQLEEAQRIRTEEFYGDTGVGQAHQYPGIVRVNRDLLRIMLHAGNQQTRVDGAHYEDQVTMAQEAVISNYLVQGVDVISDDCNLRPRGLEKLARFHQARIEYHSEFLRVPLDECLRRNAKREGAARVPDYVIESMHTKAIELGLIEESA